MENLKKNVDYVYQGIDENEKALLDGICEVIPGYELQVFKPSQQIIHITIDSKDGCSYSFFDLLQRTLTRKGYDIFWINSENGKVTVRALCPILCAICNAPIIKLPDGIHWTHKNGTEQCQTVRNLFESTDYASPLIKCKHCKKPIKACKYSNSSHFGCAAKGYRHIDTSMHLCYPGAGKFQAEPEVQ